MSTSLTYSLSPAVSQTLHIASRLALENRHAAYGGPHLLKALLHPELNLRSSLEALNVDIYYLEEWAEIRLEAYPRASRLSDTPEPDATCDAVLAEAEHFQLTWGLASMEPECLLLSLSMPGVAFSHEQLKSFPLSLPMLERKYGQPAALHNGLNHGLPSSNGMAQPNSLVPSSSLASTPTLQKFCINKLADEKSAGSIAVTGRTGEIRQLCEILSRKTKCNALITGEAGVGKSALLDGFVLAAIQRQLPDHLHGASIFLLDNSALFAGAAYKGEIEDRLQKILKELELLAKPVLLVDEIHTLMDHQNPNGGAAGILKSALSKGYIKVIATTTVDEYRKNIMSDETFSRRFELLKLSEPDNEMAEKMLRAHRDHYQDHYKLTIREDVFPEAIRLAKRFSLDRKLPDSAIDLLDRTLAVARMTADISGRDIAGLQDRLTEIPIPALDKDIIALYEETKASLSPLLLARCDEEQDIAQLPDPGTMWNFLSDYLDRLADLSTPAREDIDITDISAIVSTLTGIPLGKIRTKEQQRLVNMENHLRQRVIGQDQALKTVSDAIVESRSGLNKAGQPIASFFFLGPTGTGKTELAKSLAEFLFQDEQAMIRFDMSEFKEEHSAALLYGAPPGYVGYEEGGLLVNKIKQQPYAIVLFDEIEKAHPSVFDLFLQILDEGRMHDRLGREGDFSNAVILFTSNIGAEEISKTYAKGSLPGTEELMNTMARYFRPEFLGRVTEIVPFAPVGKDDMTRIFSIHLQPLVKQLAHMGIQLTVTPEAAEYLAGRGFTPQYGVRPLKGVIRTDLRKPLSRMIVNNELEKGDSVLIHLDEQGQLARTINFKK